MQVVDSNNETKIKKLENLNYDYIKLNEELSILIEKTNIDIKNSDTEKQNDKKEFENKLIEFKNYYENKITILNNNFDKISTE